MVFPVVMYKRESWTIKNVEHESFDKPRQHIKKQRYHFADKDLYSSKLFSGSHVWMWELDHKEG